MYAYILKNGTAKNCYKRSIIKVLYAHTSGGGKKNKIYKKKKKYKLLLYNITLILISRVKNNITSLIK